MHRESGGQTRKLSWTTTYGEDIANVCSVPGVSTTGVCKDPSKQPKDKIRRSRLFTLRFHRNVCGSLKIFHETGILFRVHGFFFDQKCEWTKISQGWLRHRIFLEEFFFQGGKKGGWLVSFKSKQSGCSANVSGSRVKEKDFWLMVRELRTVCRHYRNLYRCNFKGGNRGGRRIRILLFPSFFKFLADPSTSRNRSTVSKIRILERPIPSSFDPQKSRLSSGST